MVATLIEILLSFAVCNSGISGTYLPIYVLYPVELFEKCVQ